jgi:hypothetical protein
LEERNSEGDFPRSAGETQLLGEFEAGPKQRFLEKRFALGGHFVLEHGHAHGRNDSRRKIADGRRDTAQPHHVFFAVEGDALFARRGNFREEVLDPGSRPRRKPVELLLVLIELQDIAVGQPGQKYLAERGAVRWSPMPGVEADAYRRFAFFLGYVNDLGPLQNRQVASLMALFGKLLQCDDSKGEQR